MAEKLIILLVKKADSLPNEHFTSNEALGLLQDSVKYGPEVLSEAVVKSEGVLEMICDHDKQSTWDRTQTWSTPQ